MFLPADRAGPCLVFVCVGCIDVGAGPERTQTPSVRNPHGSIRQAHHQPKYTRHQEVPRFIQRIARGVLLARVNERLASASTNHASAAATTVRTCVCVYGYIGTQTQHIDTHITSDNAPSPQTATDIAGAATAAPGVVPFFPLLVLCHPPPRAPLPVNEGDGGGVGGVGIGV